MLQAERRQLFWGDGVAAVTWWHQGALSFPSRCFPSHPRSRALCREALSPSVAPTLRCTCSVNQISPSERRLAPFDPGLFTGRFIALVYRNTPGLFARRVVLGRGDVARGSLELPVRAESCYLSGPPLRCVSAPFIPPPPPPLFPWPVCISRVPWINYGNFGSSKVQNEAGYKIGSSGNALPLHSQVV